MEPAKYFSATHFHPKTRYRKLKDIHINLPIVFSLLKREATVVRKNIKLLFILAITGG
ncbi:hypothetical protein ACM6Q7_13525 [Peribacillus butanolivorans]|uniref:hypothetical protein n=1 Tax=Peribacillus butanolivorans TaxID=421767 RepID=UPI00366F150D